jgi:D-alanyl-D-alanine carboxypeptidase/D-alanyl-D-alanine-endopeptidase (penicillin-binding protein 4)
MNSRRYAALVLAASVCRAASLTHTLDTLVDLSPLSDRASIGIHVVDLKTGKALYERNENRFFLPASNMKLLTTALALTRLGSDYRFETRLLQTQEGDVVLAGSGDPSLSARVYPYNPAAAPGQPLHAIEEMADQAVAAGLQRVNGNIVGDDSLYPWAPYPPSWTQDDMLHNGAPVSALTLNDNLVTLTIVPGAKAGDPASIAISPALEYYAIDNRVATVGGKGEAQVSISRSPGARQVLLTGRIPETVDSIRETIAIDDPALYAASAMYDALTRRGVSITGHPVARHRAIGTAYEAPAGVTLATRTSPPLVQLLQVTDKVSQNLHAELMLREVGRQSGNAATRENGLAALNTFLTETGASPAKEARLDDGSGLSRNAQVTPRLITRLLAFMYASPAHDNWISLLPVGGQDGTLSKRLCCSTDVRSIRAKTGTLDRAMALSGYAQSKSRGWLAFSILVNDYAAPQTEIQAWIDKIALALVE